ncbi:MAG: hypothetical protein JNL60_04525, partial [Bacteroidia bacterium]|nr:hypothetical protein [Bacteroidia bacterium]
VNLNGENLIIDEVNYDMVNLADKKSLVSPVLISSSLRRYDIISVED